MKKKVIALTLSAVLALSSTAAFAAEQTNCNNVNYNNLLSNYASKFANKNNQCKVTINKKEIDLKELFNNGWKKINKEEVKNPTEQEKPEVKAPEQEKPKVETPEQKNPEIKDSAVNSSNLSYEQKVVELVNIERQKAGLSSLTLDSSISNVARTKSKDMATNNYFAHQSPTYGSAGDMLTKFGIKWSAWGENIAYGQNTPEIVVKAWMNSPGHKANILSPNFNKIGVGYVLNSSGRPYWTQIFAK